MERARRKMHKVPKVRTLGVRRNERRSGSGSSTDRALAGQWSAKSVQRKAKLSSQRIQNSIFGITGNP